MKYFLLLAFMYTSNLFACSCVYRPTIDELAVKSDEVFIGSLSSFKVIDDKGVPYVWYDVEVIETVKGNVKGGYFVKDMELMTKTSCYSQDIGLGDKYIFFSNGVSELSLKHCSSSRSYEWVEETSPEWRGLVKSLP
ncbi:MAG: hypothetical protein ACI88A_003607 [Paraglaciecola sp.]|jgi:hypothetical protein